MRLPLLLVSAILAPSLASGQRPTLGSRTRDFVSVDAPVVALAHVRVIDGTGAPARDDQTVLIDDGRIRAVGPAGSVTVPAGAQVLSLPGRTVIPGLIGLHDHTFYTTERRVIQSSFTAPRLYLASGVTTVRTTGADNPYAEINLTGAGTFYSMLSVETEDQARRVVDYWADEGVQWLKFYTAISRSAMKAAIDEAHKRGLKFTGHLCSVSHREAVALGIDALEHGLFANSDFDKTRKPDQCSPNLTQSFAGLDVNGAAARATFKNLIDRKVALTSTLAVYELYVPNRPPLEQRVLDAMAPEAREEYLGSRAAIAGSPGEAIALETFRTGMRYERAFAQAGGLLTSGVDPTGNGGALFGYGDQRNVELLVEAGFAPVEAIQVASANGAKALGIYDRTGSIEPGKTADLVVVNGNPAERIADLKNVETVFKDGWGYDSAKLIAAVRGLVGVR